MHTFRSYPRKSVAPLFVMVSVALLGMMLLTGMQTLSDDSDQDGLEARRVLATLNEWRIGVGLSPLVENETLTQMALDQAEYVASLSNFPADPHAGRSGEGPRVRALYSQYDWDTYGGPRFILIGEIVYQGNFEAAFTFWRTSTRHRDAVENEWYREAGVAALPLPRNRYLYIAVFGSRPNVLPAVADPVNRILYLSNETYARGIGDWMHTATRVRLFDGYGRPLADWQDWSPKLNLPEDLDLEGDTLGERLLVMYSDGSHVSLAHTSLLARDIALPHYAESWSTAPDLLVSNLAPTAIAILPTATPLPPPRLRLTYEDRVLTLLNVSPAPANVRALHFVSETLDVPFTDLNAGYLSGSLSALPRYNCLQIAPDLRREIERPAECVRHSVATFTFGRLFWTQGDFTIQHDGVVLATCRQEDGLCEFDLP